MLLSEWDPKSFLYDLHLDGEGEHMLALNLSGPLLPHHGPVNAEGPKEESLPKLYGERVLPKLCGGTVL